MRNASAKTHMTRITRVEIGRRDYPLIGEFKFFKSGARPSVIVRLTDASGRQGYGQAVPVESWTYETVESVTSTLEHYLAPAVLGADPTDLADVHARMEKAIRPSFSVGQPLAKAAIDLACYDLWGKQQGKPVCELLGGAPMGKRADEIRLSWTINTTDLDKAVHLLEEGRALGYDSFNVKVGPPQTPANDLDLVAPVTQFSPVEAEEFAALGMMDGIAMKVARCGGLWRASRIIEGMQRDGLKLFASGLTDPEMSLAASVHLFAWAGLASPAALNGPQYLADRGTGDAAFRAVADRVRVPSAPGLGVMPDATAIQSLTMAANS